MKDSQFEEVDLSDMDKCRAYSDRLVVKHLMEQQKQLYGKFGQTYESNASVGELHPKVEGDVSDLQG